MSSTSPAASSNDSLVSFPDEKFPINALPSTFEYGFATAAWQIEGGQKVEDGRGPSVWDDLARVPGKIVDGSDGKVAVNSYELWKEDVRILKELGSTAYRFSISWSRVIPLGGRDDPVNEVGIAYYSNLIDELLKEGIKPFITLFHWDLPSALEERYGGWSNEEVCADFVRFSALCFERFGDRCQNWITFNEPFIVLRNSSLGLKPDFDFATDTLAHPRHMVLAHAQAVDVYRREFQPVQKGTIGITLNCDWFTELGDNPLASVAVQRRLDAYLGIFADPIYLGKYPDSQARFSDFSAEQWKLIKGSSDFFGLNTYTSHYMTGAVLDTIEGPMYGGYKSQQQNFEGKWIGLPGQPGHLKCVPWGFRKIIQYCHNRYMKPTGIPLIITENGFSPKGEHLLSVPEVLEDDARIDYFRGYIGELVEAVKTDGIDIQGYFAWSLLDNLEWMSGFTCTYGSVHVDRAKNCERHVKKSGYYLREYFDKAIKGRGEIVE